MDKSHHNQDLFIGSWEQFSLCYPAIALQYITENQRVFKTQSPECIIGQAVVFYCVSSKREAILLHEYQYILNNSPLIIIILASSVRMHFYDALSLQSIIVHLVLKQGSHCFYEHDVTGKDFNIVKRQSIVTVHRDAVADYYALYAGDASIEHNYYSDVQGNNAKASLSGIFCATSNQKIVVRSEQLHTHPAAQSEVLLKGFVAQDAAVFYRGTIVIDKNAINTIARQEHKTLLLSERAFVESVPILEVLNKEVQCFHASSVGMFDQDAFFYLQSRGLNKEKARQMLLMSYIESVYKNNQKFFYINRKIALLVNSFHFL